MSLFKIHKDKDVLYVRYMEVSLNQLLPVPLIFDHEPDEYSYLSSLLYFRETINYMPGFSYFSILNTVCLIHFNLGQHVISIHRILIHVEVIIV
jgi:hypothetical protein